MSLSRWLFLPYGSTMQASLTAVAALLGIVAPALAQTTAPSTRTLKVRIEATEHDKRLLLDKLQQHGREHQLECELTDENFDYRIEFQLQYMALLGKQVVPTLRPKSTTATAGFCSTLTVIRAFLWAIRTRGQQTRWRRKS